MHGIGVFLLYDNDEIFLGRLTQDFRGLSWDSQLRNILVDLAEHIEGSYETSKQVILELREF